MVTEKPLIYTTLGNVLAAELKHQTEWVVNDDYIKFVERYLKDGVVVKESAHVLTRKGVSMEAETARLT